MNDLVACYVRVSTSEQAEKGYSIPEQKERLSKFCESMGWKGHIFYVDPGYSGAKLERPALQNLISDVENGKIRKVIVFKLDRLSRSQKDTLTLIEDIFLQNGTDFVSMTENFDTSTPFGRAIIGILSVFAQLEREQIKERMSIGKVGRAKEGRWFGGGTPPVGYDYDTEKGLLTVNEFEKIQVREAFTLFLAGASLRKIQLVFYEKGYSHKSGKWSTKTLRNVLRNPVYIGKVRWKGEIYEGVHEPIISEETFNAAQILLKTRAEDYSHTGKRIGNSVYYLTGLLKCANCGAGYHIFSHRSRKTAPYVKYYGCYSRTKRARHMIKDPDCKNKNWKADRIEGIIFDEIKKLAIDEGAIRRIKGAERSEIPLKISAIEKEMEKLKNQKSRLLDLYAVEGISLDEVKEKSREVKDKIERLQKESSDLQEQSSKLPEASALELVNSFEGILSRGNFDEIRLVLTTLIEYIEVDRENLLIHWNFT